MTNFKYNLALMIRNRFLFGTLAWLGVLATAYTGNTDFARAGVIYCLAWAVLFVLKILGYGNIPRGFVND